MNEEIIFAADKNGTYTITLANSCTQKPPYIHFRRKPTEYILYYIYEGEFFLKDGKEEYHISKNDILILDPSREHYGLKSTECKFAYVHFVSDSFNEGLNSDGININIPKYLHIRSLNNELIIRDHLSLLISIFNSKSKYYAEMTSNLLKNLLSCIALEYMNVSEKDSHAGTKSMEISTKIVEFINENYAKELNSKLIEKSLGYNFDYLNRCMKKHTGYTIIYYLNMVRVDKSKELILTGIYSFEDIACNVGFSDIYYFNKVFKKYVGITPGKYKGKA